MNQFRKILVLITLLLATNFAIGQKNQNKKDTFIVWRSLPIYDSLGNITTTFQQYDHIPTFEDSVEFGNNRMPFSNIKDSLSFIKTLEHATKQQNK